MSLIDSTNSTATELDANDSFDGAIREVHHFQSVHVSCRTDVSGAKLFIEFSSGPSNDPNWDFSPKVGGHDLSANTSLEIALAPPARYMRVRVVNGSVDMSYLRLSTRLYAVGQPPSSIFSDDDLGSSSASISTVACSLDSLFVSNVDASNAAHVRLYNQAGAVDPASDTPAAVFVVPAASTANVLAGFKAVAFSTGLQIRATTAAGNTDTSAPSTNNISCVAAYSS